jgi:hypothetical protein
VGYLLTLLELHSNQTLPGSINERSCHARRNVIGLCIQRL